MIDQPPNKRAAEADEKLSDRELLFFLRNDCHYLQGIGDYIGNKALTIRIQNLSRKIRILQERYNAKESIEST